MGKAIFLVVALLLSLAGCGNNEQEKAEEAQGAELQALSEEMEGVLLRLSELKTQLRDSIADMSVAADSSKLVRVDEYRLLLTELETAEAAYQSWKEEIAFEPEGMNHTDAMQFYEIEKEKAGVIRRDIRQAIERVESQLQQEQSPL